MKRALKYLIYLSMVVLVSAAVQTSLALEDGKIDIPPMDQNPVRDVAWDNNGNIYVVAMRWDVNRPQIKAYTPDGKPREDFNLVLSEFCCEPFPLKIVNAHDGFLYVLIPSKEGLLKGGNVRLVRIDTFGIQDKSFGTDGVLTFPKSFRLRDFDVSYDGKIWILNNDLELYTFDSSNTCVLVRKLRDIFPEEIMGGRLQNFYARNLFAVGTDKLLLFGSLVVSSIRYGQMKYHCAFEFDYDGRLIDHYEWEAPWLAERSDGSSFHTPLTGKSFIRDKESFGSIIGFPKGVRDEPDNRALAISDWSIKDGFHFYNLTSIELPKEIFLGYDLNRAFFLRNDGKTIIFFPMEKTKNLLAQVYDKDGKPSSKWFLDVYK